MGEPGEDERIAEAARHWNEGRPLEAGRILFENVPDADRPAWAAKILRMVLDRAELRLSGSARPWPEKVVLRLVGRADGFPDRPIEQVLFLAEQRSEWSQAHDTFTAIRRETLRYDSLEENRGLTDPQRLHANVCALAELTAKVTYNASDPIGPFDEDSGWWIAVILRHIIDQEWPGDVDFERVAWSVLSRRS